LSAALSGAGHGLVGGTLLSATLAVVAYGGIFTWLGLRVRRALVWGLAYILLWEGFVASAGKSASRLAVRAYTRSVLARATGVELKLANVSAFFSVAVPIAIAVVWAGLTVRRLRRTEVA
jgi:ABC-2 type transport system permease protein